MPMHIAASWGTTVELEPTDGELFYSCPRLDSIPMKPGVYVIGKRDKGIDVPLYIGKSKELRNRLRGYLRNPKQTRMRAVSLASHGKRFFAYCTVRQGRGQSMKRVLAVLEYALMEHALANGYELINIQGNRKRFHKVSFDGEQIAETIAPTTIRLLTR